MELENLVTQIVRFRDERDWQQFHTPNQLAAAIAIESAELQEHFLWKSPEQIAAVIRDQAKRTAIGEEIADIMIFALLLAHELQLDPSKSIVDKLNQNAAKYPVAKARGNNTKYNQL